jgi:UDP-glucose 4-epimerase
MRSFVVGGAGFIGSHLVDRLVQRGPVTIFDDMSVGKMEFLESALASGRVTFVKGDARDLDALKAALTSEHDVVFNLAANPEARHGLKNTRLDLELGTILTYNVLESMRLANVKKLVFSSSGTVYGETDKVANEKDLGELPISLYGASKFAGEAMIAAFVECFGLQAWIYRFGNVVGPRGTHGAALDFLNKLKAHTTHLEVLGDGTQAKPYVFVSDIVAGMLHGLENAKDKLNVYNIAPPDVASVKFIAEECVKASPYPQAEIRYTGGDRGWPGDVPKSRMDSSKLASIGFSTKHTSQEAVRMCVAALVKEVFGG